MTHAVHRHTDQARILARRLEGLAECLAAERWAPRIVEDPERARLASIARGKQGLCLDYVKNVADALVAENIADPEVIEFCDFLDRIASRDPSSPRARTDTRKPI